MEIVYKTGILPETEQIIDLFKTSGILRPVSDKTRIEKMFLHSNLIVSAWNDGNLIGIARALTDFSYCCYLSDLAVRKEFQGKDIGRQLIEVTRSCIGPQVALVLVSAPAAMGFYSKIGLEKSDRCFILKREE